MTRDPRETSEANWKEIAPGVFARRVSSGERKLDPLFVEKVAGRIASRSLRLLILETKQKNCD